MEKLLKRQIISEMAENYRHRLTDKFLDKLCGIFEFEDFGILKSACDMIMNDESIRYFPNVAQIKQAVKSFRKMHGQNIDVVKEVPCNKCLGRGWIRATSTIGGVSYEYSFQCHCPNGRKCSELPFMPKGKARKIMPDGKTVELIYLQVEDDIEYSDNLVDVNTISQDIKSLGLKMKMPTKKPVDYEVEKEKQKQALMDIEVPS